MVPRTSIETKIALNKQAKPIIFGWVFLKSLSIVKPIIIAMKEKCSTYWVYKKTLIMYSQQYGDVNIVSRSKDYILILIIRVSIRFFHMFEDQLENR